MLASARCSPAVLALALLTGSPASGQQDAPSDDAGARPPLGQRFTSAARHLGQDAGYLVTFPRRITRRGVARTSAVAGGIVLLVLLDDEIRQEVQEARTPSWDRWEERFEPLGRGAYTFGAGILVYVTGRLARAERATETGRALLEALTLTQTFTWAGKAAFGRAPPGPDARAADFWDGESRFPSGHTSRAFTVATVLARRHGRVAAWIGYPLATLVGLARIESDSHWASDVLAGAALGYAVGRVATRRRQERAGGVRAALAPSLSLRGRGPAFLVTLRF